MDKSTPDEPLDLLAKQTAALEQITAQLSAMQQTQKAIQVRLDNMAEDVNYLADHEQEVQVNNFDISFGNIIWLLIKWSLASFLVFGVLYAILLIALLIAGAGLPGIFR